MRILKIVGLTLLSLLAILLIAGIFVSKEIQLSREITINQPSEVVYDYLRYLKNQDNWSVWSLMDPNQKLTYTGTDGTVGFISAWDGEKTGKGQQEIINLVPSERIETKLKFIEPFPSESDAVLTVTALDPQTSAVSWGFYTKSPYPFNVLMLFFNIEEGVGKDYEQGLQNLKTLLENQQE